MAKLQRTSVVLTVDHEKVRILDELGEGGQGVVYRVEFRKSYYALKWYPRGMGIDEHLFYSNILQNVQKGSPAETFLWPLALTQRDIRGRFGYIMQLRPPEYREFSRFLLNREKFAGFQQVLRSALLIAASFRQLHLNGLSYQDLNDGNFFVHPRTGEILICDNDNIVPHTVSLGIKGKPRYMAPEVVLGECKPDVYTDRFSLAVILFLLLCRNHPLEGSADNGSELPEINERRLFAEHPVFIFDPDTDVNRPKTGIHSNALRLWPLYPRYIQELFIRSFAYDTMRCANEERQNRRVTEKDWIRAFFRLQDGLALCPCCHEETFYDTDFSGGEIRCMNCGEVLPLPAVLHIRRSRVVLYPGKRLYPYHLESGRVSVADLEHPVAEVVRKEGEPGIWGIRNLTGNIWCKLSPGGQTGECAPGETIPVARGMRILFNNSAELSGIIE